MSAEFTENREKGAAPLSIGSSLALEGLCGFGEFPQDNPAVGQIDSVWVNLRTLFRNAYGSIPRESQVDLKDLDMAPVLATDMRVLLATLQNQTFGRVKTRFYVCNYASVKIAFPMAKLRNPTTVKQQHERHLENTSIERLLAENDDSGEFLISRYDIKPNHRDGRTVLLTHYPVDLLWRDRFQTLHLLESHTGKVKSQAEWYTKLTGGKDFTRIPFNRMTLQVFGDGNTLFSSMDRKLKQRLLEIAEAGQWNPATTDDRVRLTLDQHAYANEKIFYGGLLTR